MFEHLNPKQTQAVFHTKGPLLIIAGAGSGKTRALTYKIAYLIKHKKIKPWNILAVTFTNKAADELKRRIQSLLKIESWSSFHTPQPVIGTFHSLCVRILRKDIEHLGYNRDFAIYDNIDSQSIIKKILKKLNIDNKKFTPRMVLSQISKAKNILMSAKEYELQSDNYFTNTVSQIYREYETRLYENNALDFDDLLNKTVNLFRKFPKILDYYQDRWIYILIDEYQDTNYPQYAITSLLSQKYRNICVIGDSDQSIYAFRGATVKNILSFKEDYPDARVIKLEQNYRSTQNILESANSVIEKNKFRPHKKMWTEAGKGNPIDIIRTPNEEEEGKVIAQEIKRLKKEKILKDYNEAVVLYRTNAQSRVIEEIMMRYSIPYQIVGGVKFYQRKEIKDILAYARIIKNPLDNLSLLRIINVPPRRIGSRTVTKLQRNAQEKQCSLWTIIENIKEGNSVDFKKIIQNLIIKSQGITVSSLIRQILEKTGYKNFLLDGTPEGVMRYENCEELISVAGKYDDFSPQESLALFLEEAALISDIDSLDEKKDAVTLMTMHSAKGLEFPFVFIIGCEENILPHARTLLNEKEIEEERRLMYVGMTRAMKNLYLTYARERMFIGSMQYNPPSRFILDIPEYLTKKTDFAEDFTEKEAFSQLQDFFDDFNQDRDPISKGDMVEHHTFGKGVVIEQKGDILTISFTNGRIGLKKFVSSIAPLKKI